MIEPRQLAPEFGVHARVADIVHENKFIEASKVFPWNGFQNRGQVLGEFFLVELEGCLVFDFERHSQIYLGGR